MYTVQFPMNVYNTGEPVGGCRKVSRGGQGDCSPITVTDKTSPPSLWQNTKTRVIWGNLIFCATIHENNERKEC